MTSRVTADAQVRIPGRLDRIGSGEELKSTASLLALVLTLLLAAVRIPAQTPTDLPDISGVYATDHPTEDLGTVYVRFQPALEPPVPGATDDPVYEVSLWAQRDGGMRKLRQGLFGTYTAVALQRDENGLLLVWQSPVDDTPQFNRLVRIDPALNLHIGSDDPDSDSKLVVHLLRRDDRVELPGEIASGRIDLDGIYHYSHHETGSVYVRFEKTGETMPGGQGREIAAYRVTTLARVGEVGFCPVREGLFGGSFPDDAFTRAGIAASEVGRWLVWGNPDGPGSARRNFVVARYANGDIGIGSHSCDDPLEEESILRRVAGQDARVGGHADLLTLPGLYAVTFGTEEQERIVRIGPGGPVHPVTIDLPLPSSEFTAGAFSHVSLVTRNGRGYLRWLSLNDEASEENLVFDVDADGSFLLAGGPYGARHIVAEFTRLADLPPGSAGSGKPEVERRQSSRELLLHAAREYYGTLPAAVRQRWWEFALWPRDFASGGPTATVPALGRVRWRRPQNVDPDGYASPDGMLSPAMDFATFAVEYFLPLPYRDPLHHVRNRLPGRTRFFEELFGPSPSAWQPQSDARTFRDWIDPAEVEAVEVVVTAPTATAPESLAGHVLLLIRRRGDHHDGRDSLVIGFVGITSTDKNNDVDGITYAWRGLTGHYPSAIQEETLASLVERATILEDRDVRRFELNLSHRETERLIERIWVVKNTFTYEYRFFSVNCASMLLDCLNYAFEGKPIEAPGRIVPPLYVVALLGEHGRLGDPVLPEYHSLCRAARESSAENEQLRREILELIRSISRGPAVNSTVNHARELFRLARSTGEASVQLDPLFRTPVLTVRTSQRAGAYRALADLAIDLIGSAADHGSRRSSDPATADGRGTDPEARQSALVEKLLRYLMNAYERELYVAIPTDVRSHRSRPGNIPSDVVREIVNDQLLEVQLRQQNSAEIQALRRAVSTLRIAASDLDSDESFATVQRRMQTERNEELARRRAVEGQAHGYFPWGVTLGARLSGDPATLAPTIGMSLGLFSEEMGHISAFALKRDMAMEIALVGVEAEVGVETEFGDGQNQLTLHATLFDFQKVLTGADADYRGVLNHGFGFTLLDASATLRDQPSCIQSATAQVRVVDLRYVLNLFERLGFHHFLNLSLGPACLIEKDGAAVRHIFALPVRGQFKLAPGGRPSDSLRLTSRYEPRLDLEGGLSHDLGLACGLSWNPSRRPRATVSIEAVASATLEFDSSPEAATPSTNVLNPRLDCFVNLR